MAQPPTDGVISMPGKKFMLLSAIGCLAFFFIMIFGTYALAQVIKPYLKKVGAPPVESKRR